MDVDPDSLERLVPDRLRHGDATGDEALQIGLERYDFAATHAGAGRLLDIACGVGYGTRRLSDRAAGEVHATGVDLSEAAIEYARARYANERTRFLICDAMRFEDDAGFDTIVTIETLEHLPDPAGFVARILPLLRPGGRLIASVPTTPSVDANPHHLHDFSERSFRALFCGHGLQEIDAFQQEQPYRPGAIIARSEPRLQDMRRNLVSWYARHPDSLARRIAATLRFGFKNRYITIAWKAPA